MWGLVIEDWGREEDSWGKWRDDLRKDGAQYCLSRGISEYSRKNCEYFKAWDLESRAKALAKKED